MEKKQMDGSKNQVEQLELEDQMAIYKAYINDAEKISKTLEEHFKKDLDLFRVEVHGIKSMSRQLGYRKMGDVAEIMEMAAKAQNLAFIERKLEQFRKDLCTVVADAQNKLDRIKEKMQHQSENAKEENELDWVNKAELLMTLKDAFLCFDLDRIEQILAGFNRIPLNEKEQALLEKLCTCAEELEYEQGVALIKAFE